MQAIGVLSSLVRSSVDTTARPSVAYQDMIAVRNELVAAIDQESMTATDKVYV